MATEVKLPELAEGVEKGDVVNLMVKVGDMLDIDMPMLEVESEKATLTVPSSVKGKITKLLIKQGDKVAVGQPILEHPVKNPVNVPSRSGGHPVAPAADAAPEIADELADVTWTDLREHEGAKLR